MYVCTFNNQYCMMRNPTLTIDNDRPHLSTGISLISDLAHDSAVQCYYHLPPIIHRIRK